MNPKQDVQESDARELAARRGHDIGEFYEQGHLRIAECLRPQCGKRVIVEEEDEPSGTALSGRCRGIVAETVDVEEAPEEPPVVEAPPPDPPEAELSEDVTAPVPSCGCGRPITHGGRCRARRAAEKTRPPTWKRAGNPVLETAPPAPEVQPPAPEPEVTIEQVREGVDQCDIERTELHFHTGVVLLAACVVGCDEAKIAAFTGYDLEFVAIRAKRARENGIWKDGKTHAGWLDEHGTIAFVLDVLVAEGICVQVVDGKPVKEPS